ncbi:hypothetical protein NBM05_03885 [Rothia sp. AR01]|uniref:Uncharacterized protein n=1 Tax=Rothia santali TaxID=2949643 RepID=A0A9X2HJ36_9MICC|nr:hypothetical protein [Rothia santali]MCP3425188.1 hypothetical protein [Rothia santali]
MMVPAAVGNSEPTEPLDAVKICGLENRQSANLGAGNSSRDLFLSWDTPDSVKYYENRGHELSDIDQADATCVLEKIGATAQDLTALSQAGEQPTVIINGRQVLRTDSDLGVMVRIKLAV